MSISFEQTITSYSKYPSIEGDLPEHLEMQTVPLLRKEKAQYSVNKNGDLNIFCEFIPVQQTGITSEQLPSQDLEEEPRYFHYRNGFASYYDESRNLISEGPHQTPDLSQLIDDIRANKNNLDDYMNGIMSGNPFLWAMELRDTDIRAPKSHKLSDTSTPFRILESYYLDEASNTNFRQEALINNETNTLEQFRTYDASGDLRSIQRLKYSFEEGTARLVFIEDVSKAIGPQNMEFIYITQTEYENFKVTFNLD